MSAIERRRPNRREFVGILGGGAASLLGLRLIGNAFATGRASSGQDTRGEAAFRPHALDGRAIRASATASRVLVVIELAGGNDGLSTVVPYGASAYRTLRKSTAIDEKDVVRIDDTFGFHPNLAVCAPRLAVLQGVGAPDASGSHFEMSARWWTGDVTGKQALATGFLGRVCDALDVGAPVTGVSLAGATPALLSDNAVTIGLPSLNELQWLTSTEPWFRNLRQGYGELAGAASESSAAVHARTGVERALAFAGVLGEIGEPPAASERPAYPASNIGDQLRLAATLIGAHAGVRVVHAQLGGFDTHTNQRGTHDQLMRELAESLTAFADDLGNRGLTESVLIATTSEFGRRAKENNSGTDHGTASCALLMGPVTAGLHGAPLSLTDLDASDNLRATTTLEEYYATLAEHWFGIDAARVLPTKPKPIAGVLNA